MMWLQARGSYKPIRLYKLWSHLFLFCMGKLAKPGWSRFGLVTVRAWDGSSGSGFRFQRCLFGKAFFVSSIVFNRI